MTVDREAIERTRLASAEALLAERTSAGGWEGELSSSALSTATAAFALLVHGADEDRTLAVAGLEWLAASQNEDGGWGDTTDSPSNISTTTLAWVALGVDGSLAERFAATAERARARLERDVGDPSPEGLARAITAAYGDDRTFSVPILATCAIGGRLGPGAAAWREIPAIPFELAALPHQLFRWLGLPMVSYALPALIAIGQVIHHHRPSRNPAARLVRNLTRERTLRELTAIQPETGGFLEATPITSFVAASLVACGRGDHPVVQQALRFLRDSVRADGSWPIDTHLATWVTSLSIDALAGGGRLDEHFSAQERERLAALLLDQQHRVEHPYTHAAPGGWAWTPCRGASPTPTTRPEPCWRCTTSGGRTRRAPRRAPAGCSTWPTATAASRPSAAAGASCPSTAARRT